MSISLILLLFYMNGSAQEPQFLWAKSFYGQRDMNNIVLDKIASIQTDSIGNIYVFGTFGFNAQLEGRYICPMEYDTTHAIANANGLFLAKFDTLGTMQWCKSARFRGNGYAMNIAGALDMVIKDGKIHILGWMDYMASLSWRDPDWCWFFDTLYECPGCSDIAWWRARRFSFPFHDDAFEMTVYVVFDTDGNKLEYHDLRLLVDYETVNGRGCMGNPVFGKFVLDSDDNILLFTEPPSGGWNHGWDRSTPPYIIIDGDTSRHISTGLEDRFNGFDDQLSKAMLWKIDRNWRNVECKLIIDSIAGWSRRFKVDSVYSPTIHRNVPTRCQPVGFHYDGILMDEQNHITLSGYMSAREECAYTYYHGDTLQELELPCRFYLDSLHYIVAENLSMLNGIPVVMQYDHNGNVRWCNQLYSETSDTGSSMYGGFTQCMVDSFYLYLGVTVNNFDGNIFFDASHLDTFPQTPRINLTNRFSTAAHYALYNKESGVGVSHYLLDTATSMVNGEYAIPVIENGKSVWAVTKGYPLVSYMATCDLSTNEIVLSHPVKGRLNTPGLILHPHGFVIRSGNKGKDIEPCGTDITIASETEQPYILFYYDSTLDCRRPHATPPTPPDPPDDSTAVRTVKAPAMTFTLSPNPTNGEVTVVLPPLSEGAMLTVADATGREVRRQTLPPTAETTRLRLDLKGLPAGAYFVTLVTPQGSRTEKLVVE